MSSAISHEFAPQGEVTNSSAVQESKFDEYRVAHHTLPGAPRDTSVPSTLPDIHLSAQDFSTMSRDVFDRVDIDGDGKLTVPELALALRQRLVSDTDKSVATIKKLYDNYEFLQGLSPQWSTETRGITKPGLDLASQLALGTLKHDDVTLNRTHRAGWASGMGQGLGWLTGSVGAFAGMSTFQAMATTSAGWYALGFAGTALGMTAGVGLAVAAGYAIGYGIDRIHKYRSQEREVNTFLRSLDVTPRSSQLA